MLTIIETPHRGPARTWHAKDREDFCTKVLASAAHSDLSPDATYEEIVKWLDSDLQKLEITEA